MMKQLWISVLSLLVMNGTNATDGKQFAPDCDCIAFKDYLFNTVVSASQKNIVIPDPAMDKSWETYEAQPASQKPVFSGIQLERITTSFSDDYELHLKDKEDGGYDIQRNWSNSYGRFEKFSSILPFLNNNPEAVRKCSSSYSIKRKNDKLVFTQIKFKHAVVVTNKPTIDRLNSMRGQDSRDKKDIVKISRVHKLDVKAGWNG